MYPVPRGETRSVKCVKMDTPDDKTLFGGFPEC